MQENRNQTKNDGCSGRIIRAMEEFLWALINNGSRDDIILELTQCGDEARPYLTVVNGIDPGNTLSAALSYLQYVRYSRGEITVNKDYLVNINEDLSNPRDAYSIIVDNLAHALRAQDYVTAAFLADLAFIARAYMLCLSNGGDKSCDWLRRSFTVRVLILRSRINNY
ncbi:hypothetical protein Vsou_01840 [Vulcanisaeta souniana JCM 11219]|uniref:Uncharacterized protein n=2 Tax=Vulcanisaeta souniana TaxID=164452 RepID=A0A830E2M9_9CREN|nr:hypothetical protein Vsou_01840 [Vulcanisaeta souniana JCM 11219]GGI80715.1 hypothetical protein GCM10007112_16930 [Vulcanisaeta souniana JCM 11219]